MAYEADVLKAFIDRSLEPGKVFVQDSASITPKITLSGDEAVSTYNIGVKIMDKAFKAATVSLRDGSFNNPQMGTGTSNLMLNSAYFNNELITFRRTELLAIYNGCWVFRKIVDVVARDMWSNGFDINCEGNDDNDLSKVYSMFNKLKSDLIYATEQARIFGGAAALMMVDDGEEDLSKPLRIENIKPGAKVNFLITDRWYGLSWSSELVDDYRSAEFGLPKYYSFFIDGMEPETTDRIHYSRVLRFTNRRSPRLTQQMLQGWGISELEHILQDLMNHENTKNSIASLLNKALLEIVKLEGMRTTMSGLSSGNPQAAQMFSSQMAALNNYRTSNKLVFMDKQDEYEDHSYAFSGLSEILESQKDIIAGAAEMPEVMIFGTNRAGLNGDKPVELRIYDNTIQGKQDAECRPVLDKLLPVLFRCCGMEVPKDLTYEFISMLADSDETRDQHLNTLVNTLSTLMENGLMTHETALEELLSAVKKTNFGTKIEERDKELAKKTDQDAASSEGENENGLTIPGMGGEEEEEEPQQTPQSPSEISPVQPKTDDYKNVVDRVIKAALRDRKKFK